MKLVKTALAATAVIGLTVAASVTAANASDTPTTRPPNHERTDPARTVLDYGKALDADNLDGVLETYAADPVVAPPGQPVKHGTDEVSKFYSDLFTAADVQITFTVDSVNADHDLAYVTTHSLGTLVFKDGSKPFTGEGRELFVLKRTGDSWKIAAYWFNN
jgi:ketosteroid isomerase-like protein